MLITIIQLLVLVGFIFLMVWDFLYNKKLSKIIEPNETEFDTFKKCKSNSPNDLEICTVPDEEKPTLQHIESLLENMPLHEAFATNYLARPESLNLISKASIDTLRRYYRDSFKVDIIVHSVPFYDTVLMKKQEGWIYEILLHKEELEETYIYIFYGVDPCLKNRIQDAGNILEYMERNTL